jgi:tetratricopeptide (TPR) repeat protein
MRLQDLAGARSSFIKALAMDFHDSQVLINIRVLKDNIVRMSPNCLNNTTERFTIANNYPSAALFMFEQVILADPFNAGSWNDLGVALWRAGRLEEASFTLKAARRLMPNAYSNTVLKNIETMHRLLDADEGEDDAGYLEHLHNLISSGRREYFGLADTNIILPYLARAIKSKALLRRLFAAHPHSSIFVLVRLASNPSRLQSSHESPTSCRVNQPS